MIGRRLRVVVLFMLLFSVSFLIYGSTLVHGHDYYGQGCYCHNNGIGMWVNGTSWSASYGYSYIINIIAGGSVSIIVNTTTVEPSPAACSQQWISNQSDNSKFTISPQTINDNDPNDLNRASGAITARYKVSCPATLKAGWYKIVCFAQGNNVDMLVSVDTPVPEFNNAPLILTYSVIGMIIVALAIQARKRFP